MISASTSPISSGEDSSSSVTSSLRSSESPLSVRFGSVEVRKYEVLESTRTSLFEPPATSLGQGYEYIGSASVDSFEEVRAPPKGFFNFLKQQLAKPSTSEVRKYACSEELILAAIEAENKQRRRSSSRRSFSRKNSK